MQYALINTDRVATVARYMPSNYAATALGTFTLVFGEDVRGYTLDDYVIPRLASGLFFQVREGVSVHYDEEMGIFSLVDDEEPFDPPIAEVWVYTMQDWEERNSVARYLQASVPPDGYDYWTPYLVESEVERVMEQSNVRYVLDPGFDSQAAADMANESLSRAGLLDEEA